LKHPIQNFKNHNIKILIDRFTVQKDNQDNNKRISDSIQTAFYEAEGECIVTIYDTNQERTFNNRFELDGITFIEPTPQL
jgi:excinuclease ABC subunit A